MKLLLDWIAEFVDVPELNTREMSEKITLHTAEVEGIDDLAEAYDNMVVGRIAELAPHPDADRLQVAQVDLGGETSQLVCGGQNLKLDMLVAIAKPGAKVRWHGEGELVELSVAKVRGVESHGMICAGEEIGLETDNPEGQKEVRIKDLSHLNVPAGTPLAEALGRKGLIVDIDNKSLTHRPDLWGHYGFAREISAMSGNPLTKLDDKLYSGEYGNETEIKLTIESDELCPRFSAVVVKGIQIAPSPAWMQARLEAAGMSAISNIVDITNYVMLELGQPMHAYDRQVVGSDELTIGFGREGVKLVTLDENEQELSTEDPVIYNAAGEPLILAGIKGGLKSGISDQTTEIILEAANWNPVMVRKASTRHALRTDASQRFEKGLDPANTELAIKRALQLIKELCPEAEVISPLTTAGAWTEPKNEIAVSPDKVREKIGLDISNEEMIRILTALEFQVEDAGEGFIVKVPSHRSTGDVSLEEDIVEEVARMYGYDQIPAILPELPINLPAQNKRNLERVHKHDARELLAHVFGMDELNNYSFYGKELMEKCLIEEAGHIKVLNYLSEDQTHMRTSLVPNVLTKLELNSREFPEMRVFELGRTYWESDGHMPHEEKHLIAAVAGQGEQFYLAKGVLEGFLERFQIPNLQLKPSRQAPSFAHPKKCLDLLYRGQCIGQLFTLHPGVKAGFDIAQEVAMFELNFGALVEHGRKTVAPQELAKFPGMQFDVSVLVAERTEVGKLLQGIKKASKLTESAELFDTYQGKGIPEGQKSLTFRVSLRHPERTLTDQELHEAQEATFAALEKLGGEIRGR